MVYKTVGKVDKRYTKPGGTGAGGGIGEAGLAGSAPAMVGIAGEDYRFRLAIGRDPV